MKDACLTGVFSILMRALPLFLLFSAANLRAQTTSMDGLDVSIETETYLVSGNSLRELSQQLERRGPRGGWALTEWYVYWNENCDIRFEATTTLPRVMGLSNLSPEDQDKVEDMLLALELHENIHVRTGLYAAEEIKRYDCREPNAIIEYWKRVNDEFDIETRNGRSQGVTLQ